MLRPSLAAWVSAAAALLIAPAAWAAPPAAPTSVVAGAPAQGNDVAITFTAAEGERFQLHRGTTADFTPSASTRVRACFTSPCADAPATPGTYTYKLIAEGASGEASAADRRVQRLPLRHSRCAGRRRAHLLARAVAAGDRGRHGRAGRRGGVTRKPGLSGRKA